MAKTKIEYISMEEIIRILAKTKKNKALNTLIEKIGFTNAAIVCENLAGELLYIPTRSTLWRAAILYYAQKYLEGVEKNSKDYKKRLEYLAQLFNLPKKAFERMMIEKKYIRE